VQAGEVLGLPWRTHERESFAPRSQNYRTD
jgi:hypothetical protein